MDASDAEGGDDILIPTVIDDVPTFVAAYNGDLEYLQRLASELGDIRFRIRCESSRDGHGRTAFHFAAGQGFTHICEYLIETVKVDFDMKSDFGSTPLLSAAAAGHTHTAEYLINQGADIAVSDYNGLTALHFAAGTDDVELLEYLLSKDANIEAKSLYGTALQYAAAFGKVQTVECLLRHGANVNSVTPLSVTPLMNAIYSHSYECFELLLQAGADPNVSSFGMSPLAYAALFGQEQFLNILLQTEASTNSISTACLKPIEYAAMGGHRDSVRILFPVTQSILDYPHWSVDGIFEYFHSEMAKFQREVRQGDQFQLMRRRGRDAEKRKDYLAAIKWYSKAININACDAKLLAKRSSCWVQLGEAACALYDAKICVQLRPDWPKAYCVEGQAWMLHKNYIMAADTFRVAHEMDPENEDIFVEYRNVVSYGHSLLRHRNG